MGMTDLQFKSWLRHLTARLEGAEERETREAVLREIEMILRDLREDLQGQAQSTA